MSEEDPFASCAILSMILTGGESHLKASKEIRNGR